MNKTPPRNVYRMELQLSAPDVHHPFETFYELRVYSKPLYLFEREVAVYNDLKKFGPSDPEEIHLRHNEVELEEVTQVLKDLTGRGVVMKITMSGRRLFRIKRDSANFKILKRPSVH